MALATKLPSYKDAHEVLSHANADMGPDETHGLLCGFICAGTKMNGKAWVEPVLGVSNATDVASETALSTKRQLVLDMYAVSYQQLDAMEFDFTLLMPDDDEVLSVRARSLGLWCHGFISGLGLAGITETNNDNTEVRETLFHLSEIAKIDYDVLAYNETDEQAFMQVIEYVRMAVLGLYSELVHDKTRQEPLFDRTETIH